MIATPLNDNKHLYNGGREWQNDFSNLLPDYYQTFYRNYDAATARFIAVDPMAESTHSMTTYQYAGNNPVMLNDPMGSLARPAPPSRDPTPVIHLHNYLEDQLNDDANFGDSGDGGAMGGDGGGVSAGLVNYLNMIGEGPDVVANIDYQTGEVTGNGLSPGQAFAISNSIANGNLPALSFGSGGSINVKYWTNWSGSKSSDPVIIGATSHIATIQSLGVDGANQGGPGDGPGPHNGYDLNPNSVGHNYFSSVYIGPNNPVSYNGLKYYYNIAPKNRADAGARSHDLGYDAVHAKGVAGVFFDTDALPADFKLIGNEFSLGANPFNGATYTERGQGFLISIGIGIAIIPKAIIYGLSAVKN